MWNIIGLTTTKEIQPATDDRQNTTENGWRGVSLSQHDYAAAMSFDWLEWWSVTVRPFWPDVLLIMRQFGDKFCERDIPEQTTPGTMRFAEIGLGQSPLQQVLPLSQAVRRDLHVKNPI